MQTYARPAATGYSATTITKPPNWHGLVAWDMLLNNLATGTFLAAALAEIVFPAAFRDVCTFAYPLALVLLLADLACLVFDLGDPLRFHHMLRIFKPRSPMSVGTWCLTIYSLPLTLLAAVCVPPVTSVVPEWVRTVAIWAGLLPAFGSALYKGVLFSTTAQPGWRNARWFGAYLTNSAFLLGAALLLVLSVVLGHDDASRITWRALLLLLPLNAVLLGLLLWELRPHVSGLLLLAALAGVLLPLGLLLVGFPALDVIAAVIVIAAALVIRYELVMIPHAVTAHAPLSPAGERGRG